MANDRIKSSDDHVGSSKFRISCINQLLYSDKYFVFIIDVYTPIGLNMQVSSCTAYNFDLELLWQHVLTIILHITINLGNSISNMYPVITAFGMRKFLVYFRARLETTHLRKRDGMAQMVIWGNSDNILFFFGVSVL